MKVESYYFSGTGNTAAIALAYEKALRLEGHNVHTSSIEDTSKVDDHDLLILGAPIYASNMPELFFKWFKSAIPDGHGKKAIVYSTSAVTGNAKGIYSVGKKLQKKGYELVDIHAFVMPRNYYIDRFEPTPKAQHLEEIKTAANEVLASIEAIHHPSPVKIDQSVFFIDFFAKVFRLMAIPLGKKFAIEDHCINCLQCEKNCPMQNIDVKTKTFKNACIQCTRCIHECPVNAITYNHQHIEPYKLLDQVSSHIH